MDLVKSGAVTNRCKALFRGKCLTSYACGSPELLQWPDQNRAVEFQPVDKVYDPIHIGRNPRFVAVIPARKVDLSGRIQLHTGKGYVSSGSAEVMEFFMGAQLSEGGFTVFGLPSRSRDNQANIVPSIKGYRNRIDFREAVDHVASLKGLTLRERVQALVEIAHPGDRAELIARARQAFIVDEAYQRLGICGYLLQMLVRLARQHGIKGFYADVLASNTAMLKVFRRCGLKVDAHLDEKCYSLAMALDEPQPQAQAESSPAEALP
jgi:acyl-CoA hydrolase